VNLPIVTASVLRRHPVGLILRKFDWRHRRGDLQRHRRARFGDEAVTSALDWAQMGAAAGDAKPFLDMERTA
jgi:hypothetical protein